MSLRMKLRESTAGAHTQIEANALLSQLMSPNLTESVYRQILERYYGFFRAFESKMLALTQNDARFADFKNRVKTPALEADLRAFGLSREEILALPVCHSFPELDSSAARLGALYVTEGSALGGLMIARHLAGFSFHTPARASFFHGDPKGVSERWKSFLETLESVPENEHDRVIATASQMFEALDRWMGSESVSGSRP